MLPRAQWRHLPEVLPLTWGSMAYVPTPFAQDIPRVILSKIPAQIIRWVRKYGSAAR